MSEPHVTLLSDGLLSKWGFGDGDAPDEWFDWCDDQGIDWATIRSWRGEILPDLVRRFLMPAIEQEVKLVDIATNHNPIRAETVDGVNVHDCWYDSSDCGPKLTPEYVEIPFSEVLKIARKG